MPKEKQDILHKQHENNFHSRQSMCIDQSSYTVENIRFPYSVVLQFHFILSEESIKTHVMRGSVPLNFCLQKWKVLLPQYSELSTPSSEAQLFQYGHLWNTEDM